MSSVRTAERLHKRLLALGLDVDEPKRIWLGRATDVLDYWRWEAAERISKGATSIGCDRSMKECAAASDADLKYWLDHSSGRGVFRKHGIYKRTEA